MSEDCDAGRDSMGPNSEMEVLKAQAHRPREWWVWFAASRWYAKPFFPIEEMSPIPSPHWQPLHVIEFSAFESMRRKLDVVAGQSRAFETSMRTFCKERDEARAEVERLRGGE